MLTKAALPAWHPGMLALLAPGGLTCKTQARACTKQNTKNHIWLQTLAPDVGGVAERAVLPCAPHATFRDPSF